MSTGEATPPWDSESPWQVPRIKVWKFGGTSMANPATYRRLADCLCRPVAATQQRERLLVVCSAVAGVTDCLLAILAAKQAGEPVDEHFVELESRHDRLINALFSRESIGAARERLRRWLGVQATLLRHNFATLGNAVDPAFRDHFCSGGERLSTALLTLYLAEQVSAKAIDARKLLVTDGEFGSATVLESDAAERVQHYLVPLLARHRVVITQGFVGATSCGKVTTLGRGGSDTSATWLARFLRADEVVIWTDTPGVMSADPRKVANVQTLRRLTYTEAGALAKHGAKVLHSGSMRPLRATGIPVHVRDSFQPEGPATVIGHEAPVPRFAVSESGPLCLARIVPPANSSYTAVTRKLRHLTSGFWDHVVAFDLGVDDIQILLPLAGLAWLADEKQFGDVTVVDDVSALFVLQRFGRGECVHLIQLRTLLLEAGVRPLFATPGVPVQDSLIAVPQLQVGQALQLVHDHLLARTGLSQSARLTQPLSEEVCL